MYIQERSKLLKSLAHIHTGLLKTYKHIHNI